MAEHLISIVGEKLFHDIIEKWISRKFNLERSVSLDVVNLWSHLNQLQPLLAHAEMLQGNNAFVKSWLDDLRDVIYAADGLLDEWFTKIAISDITGTKVFSFSNDVATTRKMVLSFFLPCCCSSKPVKGIRGISEKLKVITERSVEIAARGQVFGFLASRSEPLPLTTQLTSSDIVDTSSVIYGRDNDINAIVNKLLLLGSRHVISVVGMKGIGKTTLARVVYNQEKVVETFEKRIWVRVSHPFDLFRIGKEIMEQVDCYVQIGGEEDLHQQLSCSLRKKRFLFILDDVWTEDCAHWERLKLSLDAGASGSRIIVTTRSDAVAEFVGSTHSHRLTRLSGDESWLFFSHIALRGREEDTEMFEEIGRRITDTCEGNPFALKIIAALLREKRTIQDWKDVVESKNWEAVLCSDDIIFPLLFLSFNSLPSISKLCFVYCAFFPKDAKIYKNDLVKLWIAQGFFRSKSYNERASLERTGEIHFNILTRLSLFQDFEEDSSGNIRSCKMDDRVHDFAQFLADKECYTMGANGRESDAQRVRHLWATDLESLSAYTGNVLRTLIIRSDTTSTLPFQMSLMFPYLRAIDLSNSRLETLPDEVGCLLLLRYLDLSNTLLSELPETICDLLNLQTLKLNECSNLCKLPKRIVKLQDSLRHLELQKTKALTYLPRDIRGLIFLRTLSKFIVGGSDDSSKVSDLKRLTYLQGSLKIIGLQRVRDAKEAAEAVLDKLTSIDAYKFQFELLEGDDGVQKMEAVLKNLKPHAGLKRLYIRFYPGHRFADWMHDSLVVSNIVDMQLINCANCTELPSLGNLESLEGLKIVGANSVKHIGPKFYGGNSSTAQVMVFGKLKKFEIKDMNSLEKLELPFSKYMIMPCLSEFTLDSCPKLSSLPCFGKLESLEILKLRNLPSVRCVGLEFLGSSHDVADDEGSSSGKDGALLFPKLKVLGLHDFRELEQWNIPDFHCNTTIVLPHLSDITISRCPKLREFPDFSLLKSLETLKLSVLPEWEPKEESFKNKECSLRALEISYCTKLKAVPHFMFSPTLRKLEIRNCPEISGKQPYLPANLEELALYGDAGIFSKSLVINNNSCSISSVTLCRHSSLPEGFNQLQALVQTLRLYNCELLDLELKELQQFTKLQYLYIDDCPIIKARLQAEQWSSSLLHVPNIYIDFERITD